jgi:hypothetical protein
MNVQKKKNISTLAALLGVSLLMIGCGSSGDHSDPTPSAVPQTQEPSFADLKNKCSNNGGSMITVEDENVCRTIHYVPQPMYGFLSILDPEGSSSYWYNTNGYNTGIDVKTGDRIIFEATGTWGPTKVQQNSYFYNLIKTYSVTYNCNALTFDGKTAGSKGEIVESHNAYPLGILGRAGDDVFLLGSKFNDVVKGSGTLRFGFNAPSSDGLCAKWHNHYRFEVHQCESASGKRVSCPKH